MVFNGGMRPCKLLDAALRFSLRRPKLVGAKTVDGIWMGDEKVVWVWHPLRLARLAMP